ncbi:hypothetical protein AAEX28_13125 [Lentisphaerota bacterium WC36G]|nr:hypothetical protein LJT99_15955 [Lentisphaerae bacterium WC36]
MSKGIGENFWMLCLFLGLVVLAIDVYAIIQLAGIREQMLVKMTEYAKYFSWTIYLLCGNMAVLALVTIFGKRS